MFTVIERHEYDTDNVYTEEIVVGRGRDGQYMVVMDNAGRLETSIVFDEIEIESTCVEFYRGHGRYSRTLSGRLEGPEEHGDVGEWFHAFAD